MWLNNGVWQHPSSPDSTCSTASTTSYTLRPRLPITCNETALSCLQGRPQVRTCNYQSTPLLLSSDDEEMESEADASAEVEADSPCTQDESLTSRPRARPTPMTRCGVTNKPNDARPTPMTRGGVTTRTANPRTSMPGRPPAKEQSRSHQCATPMITICTIDQADQVMTLTKFQTVPLEDTDISHLSANKHWNDFWNNT